MTDSGIKRLNGRWLILLPAVVAALVFMAGCGERPEEGAASQEDWTPPGSVIRAAPRLQPPDSNEEVLLYEPGYDYTARVRTDLGEFTIELFGDEAPETVALFLSLASYGQYDDNIFYMIVPDSTVHTGDPDGFGVDRPGITVPGEFSEREFVAGTVGMLRREDDPNSGSGLWFVTLREYPQLKGKYAVFGQVTDGLDTVRTISRQPVIGGDVDNPNRPLTPPKILSIEVSRTKQEPPADAAADDGTEAAGAAEAEAESPAGAAEAGTE